MATNQLKECWRQHERIGLHQHVASLTPDKKRARMKATFSPPSATCPVMMVTALKCFPDARISLSTATIPPLIYIQVWGSGCDCFFWTSQSATTATCLTLVKPRLHDEIWIHCNPDCILIKPCLHSVYKISSWIPVKQCGLQSRLESRLHYTAIRIQSRLNPDRRVM